MEVASKQCSGVWNYTELEAWWLFSPVLVYYSDCRGMELHRGVGFFPPVLVYSDCSGMQTLSAETERESLPRQGGLTDHSFHGTAP